MYDRLSLAAAMANAGLHDVRVCRADESRIDDFDGFQLDRDGDQVRKPDSLFMEGIRPRLANAIGDKPVATSTTSRAA